MQLRALGRVDQLAFTELVDMARDAAFDRDYRKRCCQATALSGRTA